MRRSLRKKKTKTGGQWDKVSKWKTGYLIEVTISHQLVLVLQSVLEQGPYDGLQFWVGGQQVGAEHLQPGVGQAVHYREGMWFVHTSVIVQKLSGETSCFCMSCLLENITKPKWVCIDLKNKLCLWAWTTSYISYRRGWESWTLEAAESGWQAGSEGERKVESWAWPGTQEGGRGGPDAWGTDICKDNGKPNGLRQLQVNIILKFPLNIKHKSQIQGLE